MRQNTCAKCFGAVLLLFFTAAALAWPPSTAAQSNVPPPSEMHPGVTILTPHPGVDFDSYINRLLATVKRNWYAVMPEAALNGAKGIVVLTFHIQQDGKIPVPDPSLERSSGSKELDVAAMAAVRISAPFDPLPEAFHGPNIELRFIYFYNVPVDLFKATTTTSDSQSDPRTNLLAPLRSPLQLPPPAAAQAPLPTAKEIVDRYQAAIGGVPAWMALATVTVTYERQVDNDPAISTLKLYAKAPDKRLYVLTLPDGSVRRDGCDGKSIWTEDARGFREHTGAALTLRLRRCDFYARLHLIKSPDIARVSGIEEVAGRNAYVVEYSPDEYSKGRYYFDCENGLLVRSDETESLPEGQFVLQDFPEDYRSVDGVKIQFRHREILNGHTLLLRITQINHNVPVDDALFVKPAK